MIEPLASIWFARKSLPASHKRAWVTIIAFGLIALFAALRPAFWKFFWTPSKPSGVPGSPPAPMRRARLISVYALFALIVGGSMLDSLRDTEHWPWSNYPMYSDLVRDKSFHDFRLYGVRAGDPDSEISLYSDLRYLRPFAQARLGTALQYLVGTPKLRPALLDCLTRYEQLRHDGVHNGPPLRTIRLYEVYWTADPQGLTIEHPDRRDLILEASPGGNP